MKAVSGAILIVAAWAIGYGGVVAIASGSSAQHAYGVLSGWWLAAYFCGKIRVPILSTAYLWVGFLGTFVAAFSLNLNWFYGDVDQLSLMLALFIGCAQAFIFVSPILFDVLASWIVGRANAAWKLG